MRETSRWFTPGADGIRTQASLYEKSIFFLQDILTYKVEAIDDAELHKDFRNKVKELTPIVVSHGLTSFRTVLSAYVNELVSYGCIVYCIDHTDKSCLAYKNDSVDPPEIIYYEEYDAETHKMTQTEYRSKQLDQRMVDIKHVLNLIKEEAKADDINIDLNKLVALGHSMGGISVIEM
jgi:predicted dienelactone hydrolase